MDSIFLLNEGDRASFLHQIKHSFGCTYICLWSYMPHPSNFLLFMDGIYHEENNPSQASSSSGNTLSRILFDEHRQSVFSVETSRVPGLAFKNSLPYIEFKQSELSRLATTTTQLQFYQEARIKAAIFMGCKTGEIEIGMSNNSQVNMEMEMKKLFPEDFSRNAVSRELLLQPADQTHASSSSSSLQSFSLDNSPEYSPFVFNINPPSAAAPPNAAHDLEQPLRPISFPMNTLIDPGQQAIQSLGQMRSPQLPKTLESEEAAITKAILAVISSSSAPSPSPSSSSSTSHHPQLNVLPPRPTAFKRYGSSLAPNSQTSLRSAQRHNLFKRSISFLRNLRLIQAQGQQIQQGIRPTSNQLHRMISERRRREKLNESFQSLSSLLPSGTKRDKASVLTSTMEYLTSLKARVLELSKKNQMLEAQLLPREEAIITREVSHDQSSSERLNVQITDGGESTSESRVVNLRVNVRGECSMLDLVIRLLEFLKQVQNVSLLSVEAETRAVDTIPFNSVVLRLRIQGGGEWDESSFQEAVRRVVADLAEW